ncbi:MAG: hypothetical protein QOJ05_1135 [Verrucomicrobiota bacterium]|jgi:hypothetical protein
MDPGDALSTAAQIAVALAGFAGVVVAFRRGSLHDWAPIDRFRLWLLLGNSLVPLFGSLGGLLLLTIEPRPLWIWRCGSGLLLLLSVPFAVLSRKRQVELGPSVVAQMGAFRYVFYLFGAIGGVVALLQIYNAVVAGVFSLFYAAIVFPLAIAALQFARMILLPSNTNKI